MNRPQDFDILARDAGEFLSAFRTVFDEDWYYTKSCLTDLTMIPEGKTFLHPGLDNEEPRNQEDANWCNRRCLLDKFRSLSETLRRLQLHPDQLEGPAP